MRLLSLISLTSVIVTVSLAIPASRCPAKPTHGKKPNFVVFLTDDQDYLMHSLDYLPYVQKRFINEGT
ncbi:hypothetical protein EC988_004819, partial [Linderina pennispora]